MNVEKLRALHAQVEKKAKPWDPLAPATVVDLRDLLAALIEEAAAPAEPIRPDYRPSTTVLDQFIEAPAITLPPNTVMISGGYAPPADERDEQIRWLTKDLEMATADAAVQSARANGAERERDEALAAIRATWEALGSDPDSDPACLADDVRSIQAALIEARARLARVEEEARQAASWLKDNSVYVSVALGEPIGREMDNLAAALEGRRTSK